jgi:tetratricopeptide (TPR) repeat protein
MDTSFDLYDEILTSGPSPRTLFLVISEMKEKGQLRRVIQECLKALNIHPFDLHIRRLLAESYFESGLISQAESELDKVTTMMNDFIPTYRLQADIYLRERREEEAAEALKLFLAHRPDDQEARNLLDTLKPEEEAPAPGPEADAEEISGPAEEIATPTLAELYVDQDLIQEATATYEKVTAQHPEDERSKQRLEELKAMSIENEALESEEIGVEEIRQKKEKMITILEGWLANIKEGSRDIRTQGSEPDR